MTLTLVSRLSEVFSPVGVMPGLLAAALRTTCPKRSMKLQWRQSFLGAIKLQLSCRCKRRGLTPGFSCLHCYISAAAFFVIRLDVWSPAFRVCSSTFDQVHFCENFRIKSKSQRSAGQWSPAAFSSLRWSHKPSENLLSPYFIRNNFMIIISVSYYYYKSRKTLYIPIIWLGKFMTLQCWPFLPCNYNQHVFGCN